MVGGYPKWLPSAKFVTKVQLPNLYLRNLRKVTTRSILHSPTTEPGRKGWERLRGSILFQPLVFLQSCNPNHTRGPPIAAAPPIRTLKSNQSPNIFHLQSAHTDVRWHQSAMQAESISGSELSYEENCSACAGRI